MTKRAILWCGQVRKPDLAEDWRGRIGEVGEQARTDFALQANSLELAFSAALGLGISPDEVHACLVSDDLRPQKLRSAPHRATVAALRQLSDAIARRAAVDDALLFVAVNHGKPDGLVTSDAVDEFEDDRPVEHLTPVVLDRCLEGFPGPQVILVASCYAGVFLPLGERANRAVVVSCAADETYRVPRQDGPRSPFLDELFGAWCEVALSDAIPRTRLPLGEAFARAEERLVAANAPNRPGFAGGVTWPP